MILINLVICFSIVPFLTEMYLFSCERQELASLPLLLYATGFQSVHVTDGDMDCLIALKHKSQGEPTQIFRIMALKAQGSEQDKNDQF